MLISPACLPTLRPIWTTVRPTSLRDKYSKVSLRRHTTKTHTEKRVRPSPISSVQHSNFKAGGHNEAFSGDSGTVEEALQLIQIPEPIARANAFPNPTGTGYIGEPMHGISVETTWDVAYGWLHARHQL